MYIYRERMDLSCPPRNLFGVLSLRFFIDHTSRPCRRSKRAVLLACLNVNMDVDIALCKSLQEEHIEISLIMATVESSHTKGLFFTSVAPGTTCTPLNIIARIRPQSSISLLTRGPRRTSHHPYHSLLHRGSRHDAYAVQEGKVEDTAAVP